MAQLALSSWAVHDWIGQEFEYKPGQPPAVGTLDRVLQLPARAKAFGMQALEVCDFHLVPDRGEIERLSATCSEAGISLFQLLIDQGDMTHPTDAETNLTYLEDWIRVAAWGGFSRVRVIAGQQPPSAESIDRSVQGLCRLKKLGDELGIGVSTENWQALMATPEIVIEVLERTEVGLVLDFGNWNGPGKYDRLGRIARFATSCHAKCDFQHGQPLIDDFETCLRVAKDAGFDGNLTLVHPEPPDEWAALEPQKDSVTRVFGLAAAGF